MALIWLVLVSGCVTSTIACWKNSEKWVTRSTGGHFGHSIGCSIHFAEEYPFISAHTTDVFQPGMVFSLETPYYKEFVGAINIEDSFLITENGIDRFTHAPETIFGIVMVVINIKTFTK